MKVIMLAAGRGTRISRMVKAVPKSTLPIDGVPLIRITAEIFHKKGMDLSVCVGYKQEQIRKALDGLPVNYYYNPFFDITNSIGSLWLAQEKLEDEDIIIMNADIFFTEEILQMLLDDERDVVILVDKTRTKTGDYFFSTTDSGCIRAYGKDLPLLQRKCEYVGMAKIRREFLPLFRNRLNELIGQQKHDLWWENVIYSFTDHQERDIYTRDVEGLFWSEIDYFDDYERILNYIAKEHNKERKV